MYIIPFAIKHENTFSSVWLEIVCTYSWGKMKSRRRMSIMKDLIQVWTADFLNGNFFNRRAQTCIFKSWMNK